MLPWGFSIAEDYRNIAFAQFELLSSWCTLANMIVDDALRRFAVSIYVNERMIPLNVFDAQTHTFVDTMKNETRAEFSWTLAIIRNITHANQFIAVSQANARLLLDQLSVNQTIRTEGHRFYRDDGSPCWCSRTFGCSGPALFFNSTHLIYQEDSLRSGCFPVENALASSLACWYDEKCFERIRELFNNSIMPFENISLLNVNLTSRFDLNSTVETIVNELFVEQWNESISFDLFYNQCAPVQCLYTTDQRNNLLFVATRSIALYSGLNLVLALLVPIIITLFFATQERLRTTINIRNSAWFTTSDTMHEGKSSLQIFLKTR